MKTLKYLCPNCNGHLKVEDEIIFAVKNANNQKGLLVLHAELGNYTAKFNNEFVFKEGDILEFHCPLCKTDLTSEKNKNLAKVNLITEGKTFKIYFSKVAGEKCTYQIWGEHKSIFGEHKKKYIDFFNLSQMI